MQLPLRRQIPAALYLIGSRIACRLGFHRTDKPKELTRIVRGGRVYRRQLWTCTRPGCHRPVHGTPWQAITRTRE